MQAARGAAPAPGSCATPPLSAAPAPLQALLLALLIASASAIAAADDAKPAGAKPAAAAGAAGGAAQAGKAGGDTAAPKATGAKAEPKAAAQAQPEQQQQAAADDAPTEVITEEEVEKAVADAVAAQLQARWMGGAYGIAQASWDGLASCGAERGSMRCCVGSGSRLHPGSWVQWLLRRSRRKAHYICQAAHAAASHAHA